jgi:hypothetical protein
MTADEDSFIKLCNALAARAEQVVYFLVMQAFAHHVSGARYEIHADSKQDEGAIDSEQIAGSFYGRKKSGAMNTSNLVHGLLLRHLH